MCTVLQQHLNQTNGFMDDISPRAPPQSSSAHTNVSGGSYYSARHVSPVRIQQPPTYSYLQDMPNLKKPIDPYDRKTSTPTMHFHVPPPESKQPRGRAASYMQQLLGRRSRSHSRTGMRVLVDQIQSSTPRARSPHMNNEEPINLSHYPDGRAPEENAGKVTPIERDDFPAPPYAYAGGRRRHWSEPGSSRRDSSTETTPVESSDDEQEIDVVISEKLDRTEGELKKISNGMGKVFLQELSLERERLKQAKSRYLDPRSAARTPAARKEPHFRLRYDSPINASPSRVADHLRPWEDELDGNLSRRSNVTTPFLPQTPHPPARVISPINPIRPGYTQRAQTLPSRFSPGYESEPLADTRNYNTNYSSSGHRSDDNVSNTDRMMNGHHENIRISTTYTQGLQAATPRNYHSSGASQDDSELNRSLPNMASPLQAPNIYPLHLLFTTNYRLPGDVDRCNLEKHLSDAEFDMVFRMAREDFYKLPYWKRCDLKRRYHLF